MLPTAPSSPTAHSWPGASPIQVSLPTLLQPGHTSPGGTAGGNDKASLAGSSVKGQKQRFEDGRSQQRSWSHGLESHHKGFLLRSPLTGSMQPVPKETQRERDKSQGETTGQGSFLLGNDNAPLFRKAFLGYPSPETSPGFLPAPLHSCERDSTHSLHPGHSTGGHRCKGQSQATAQYGPLFTSRLLPTLRMEEPPSAAHAPLP